MISNINLFTDDVSIFSIVYYINVSTDEINDLKRTSGWADQWKPHITKQAQEVLFSRKIVKPFHPSVSLNEVPVECSASLKHLSLHIDQKLNFKKVYTDEKTSKEQKGI